MKNLFLIFVLGLVSLCLALAAHSYVLRMNALKDDLEAAQAAQEAQADVSAFLGHALVQERAQAEIYKDIREELNNVEDPETCRSPVLDAAFDLLRQKRANGED